MPRDDQSYRRAIAFVREHDEGRFCNPGNAWRREHMEVWEGARRDRQWLGLIAVVLVCAVLLPLLFWQWTAAGWRWLGVVKSASRSRLS